MRSSTALLDYGMMLVAALLGAGSVALFAASGSVVFVDLGLPQAAVLLLDAALSLAFFLQHSVMVRRSFHLRIGRYIPDRYQAAVYAIASGIVLALVALFWQRSETTLYHLRGAAYGTVIAFAVAGLLLLLWSVRALRVFDPLGLAPIRAHLGRIGPHELPFTVRGPYRWVRHPIYFGILILFWAAPVMTSDRLLLNILWSGWIVIGTLLEERDLTDRFGDAYREYQRRVPMLVPWHRPVESGTSAGTV